MYLHFSLLLNERVRHIQLFSVYTYILSHKLLIDIANSRFGNEWFITRTYELIKYILCQNLLIVIANLRFGNEWIIVGTYYLIYAKFEAKIYTKPIKEMCLFKLGTI